MIRLLAAFALGLAVLAVQAEPEFKEGENYEVVSPGVPTADPGKIEVVELFWYGCPHCYHFEPLIEAWLEHKPEGVEFRRIPAVFAQNWVPHARAFYAAEALGALDRLHRPLFKAMHEENRQIMDEDSLIKFAAGQGIAEQEFRDAYNGFSVDGKVRQAMLSTRDYGITGVPSVIVNGKYRSTASLAGSQDNLLKLINFLVDKEKAR